MAGMDVDSQISPDDQIIQKLVEYGVPQDQLKQNPKQGLLAYLEQKNPKIPDLVRCILSICVDRDHLRDSYTKTLEWLQWVMLRGNPSETLKDLAEKSVGQRGVCGSVWGHNDLAYRCRTCEHDPTCAICVACFQNGNHKGHDYSIMYTGGGCCDCGDITAWKREGFCVKHKGAEKIQPLDTSLARSVGPVLDELLLYWKDKVGPACQRNTILEPSGKSAADEFTAAITEMLLEFSSSSESLLNFVSCQTYSCPGLLQLLLHSEQFLDKKVTKKLHELLLKLIGDPVFKSKFAFEFAKYYPVTVSEIARAASGDQAAMEDYPLLHNFSVQIFTVPILTPRLVKEADLLGVLVSCLSDLLTNCLGDDGRLQLNKWINMYDLTVRIVDDTRYVLNHEEVSTYLVHDRPDILSKWVNILTILQGMDPHKRVTSLHVEDENENLATPFTLGSLLGNVHNLIAQAALNAPPLSASASTSASTSTTTLKEFTDVTLCSSTGKGETESGAHRQAKVGRLLLSGGRTIIPHPALCLVLECVRAIEAWLKPEMVSSTSSSSKSKRDAFGDTVGGVVGDAKGRFSRIQIIKGKMLASPKDTVDSDKDKNQKTLVCKLSDGSLVYTEPDAEIDATGGGELLAAPGWPHIAYDVASQETSFHVPLHRLLSLLLRRAMRLMYGEQKGVDFDFFGEVFGGFRSPGMAAVVMEHPLRVRVFCAQVRAGMWRKNGDAAILSAEWYRSVQWLEQGLESDLFMLQCCAALAPAESFVKTVLDRFGLLGYMSLNLTEHNEYEGVLLQEMLTFLIQLVKERRFCGLSTVENLKREIVYKLAIGDFTHSQLIKSLPKDLSKSDQLQNVLDTLAVYSNPSGMKQGKYSLRKEFWKELDLYHPRWNSRDLQSAEERYFRFCKLSPLNSQLPRWIPIYDPLRNIHRVAASRSVLEMVRAVLFYSVCGEIASVSRAPEYVLVTALHLICLSLDVCEMESKSKSESEKVESFPFLVYAGEEIGDEREFGKKQSLLSLLCVLRQRYREENENGIGRSNKYCNVSALVEGILKKFAELSEEYREGIRVILPDLVSGIVGPGSQGQGQVSASDLSDKKKKARQRQAEIMAKMRAEQSKFAESLKSTEDPNLDQKNSEFSDNNNANMEVGESVPVCSLCRDSDSRSPLCYLILLQKSKLATFAEKGTPSWDRASRSDTKLGLSLQPEPVSPFGPDSSISLEEYSIEIDPSSDEESLPLGLRNILLPNLHSTPTTSSSSNNTSNPLNFLFNLEEEIYSSVLNDLENHDLHPEKAKITKSFSVVGAYAQCIKREAGKRHRSSIHLIQSNNSNTSGSSSNSNNNGSLSSKKGKFRPIDCDGVHVSSCGHAVHQECHERYLFSLKQRYIRRLGFEGGHIVDPDQGELLCPVCRRFANSILPASASPTKKPQLNSNNNNNYSKSTIPHTPTETTTHLHFPLALSLLQTTAKTVCKETFLKPFSTKPNEPSNPALEPSVKKLATLYFPQTYTNFSTSERLSQSLLLWDTLRYSIISTEITARGRKRNYMDSLNGELNSSSGFILSLLFRVSKFARSSSSMEVLLRFKGIQLISGSVCSGLSGDTDLANTSKRRGTFTSIMEHTNEGEIFPDIQFWKQCRDPIISQDPFSSLVWSIFCLPLPFLYSTEFFLPLVHLFYLVCLFQALLTCYSQETFDTMSFSETLMHDLCKSLSDSEPVKRYFVANYFDPSCNPRDMVRRLTYPYLRRCAILYKLLTSVNKGPSYESTNLWEGIHVNLEAEMEGLGELEGFFKIPDLDTVLRDDGVVSLALKWSQHFCDEFRVKEREGNDRVLYCTPAVPFRLMQLPILYQDLLQRYVKMQCSDCSNVPEEPALCLLCGKLCSPSWKSCCRASKCPSKCQNHALTCGAGIGVFLLVRKTTILLQRSARLAFWPSPYLDAFGEEDHDMSRGRPLYLSEERYAALTYLVASHSLDRTSEVLRQTTIGLYNGD